MTRRKRLQKFPTMLTDPAAAKRDGCTAPNSLALVAHNFCVSTEKVSECLGTEKNMLPSFGFNYEGVLIKTHSHLKHR